MEGGTSTGLYILVGIVIFAIFLGLVWWFFGSKIKPMLTNALDKSNDALDKTLEGTVNGGNMWA